MKDTAEKVIAVIVAFAIGLAIGLGTGFTSKHSLKTEAVKLGHAYWEVEHDGVTEFKWKEPSQ